jgi:hypothetical protein
MLFRPGTLCKIPFLILGELIRFVFLINEGPSIESYQFTNSNFYYKPTETVQYCKESDIVSEVLLMLSGQSNILYQWNGSDFVCTSNLSLQHVSHGALCELLARFGSFGSVFNRLSRIDSILDLSGCGSTWQAFFSSVKKCVSNFRRQLFMHISNKSTSLLALKLIVERKSSDLIKLSSFITRVLNLEISPGRNNQFCNACDLLDFVYEELAHNDSGIREEAPILLKIFVDMLAPLFNRIENIYTGLICDQSVDFFDNLYFFCKSANQLRRWIPSDGVKL